MTPICKEDLSGLKVRARITLKRNNVVYFEQIDERVLCETKGCGETTRKELIAWRNQHLHAAMIAEYDG